MKNECSYAKTIYPRKVILSAIEDYRNIANIELDEKINDYYKCSFNECKVDAYTVICEFNNYLIELMNSAEQRNGIY